MNQKLEQLVAEVKAIIVYGEEERLAFERLIMAFEEAVEEAYEIGMDAGRRSY